MHRREFLASFGAGLMGLAGCVSTPGDEPTASPGSTEGSPTHTDSPTATSGPRAELAVSFDALQAGVLELNVDYFGLLQFMDTQYLFLDVAVTSGPAPALADMSFRFDGEEHSPTPDDQFFRTGAYAGGEENQSGWVLFALPETGDAEDAALRWPGGEWRPGASLRERLAAPLPTLSLEWSVPETVPINSTPTFGFTVRNEGDNDGRFIGGINQTESWLGGEQSVAAVSHAVPAGETRSWTISGERIELPSDEFTDEVGDGEPDFTYELIWPGKGRKQSFDVVEETTPTDDSGG